MLSFLLDNLATIIIGLIVLLLAVLIIVKLVRDKRKGKSSCGCGCENCAMSKTCKSSKQ